MIMKISTVRVIEFNDWNKLVRDTYGKPYNFQQQEGCKQRGYERLTVPDYDNDDGMNESIPEVINGDEMGVKFEAWLKRGAEEPLNPSTEELKKNRYYWGKTEQDEVAWKNSQSHIDMFWERNFYPDINALANDLHKKGLLEAGDYMISIDW